MSEGGVVFKLHGLLSLRRKGISRCKTQLGLGAYWFKKVLGNDFDVDADLELSGNPDDEEDISDDEDVNQELKDNYLEEDEQVIGSFSVLDSIVEDF